MAEHETELEANVAQPLSSQTDLPENIHFNELASTPTGLQSATGLLEAVSVL